MRANVTLRRLAISVWLGWVALYVLLTALLACRMWRPPLLVIIPPLLFVILAALGVMVVGLCSLIRAPDRAGALAWLLIGTAPLWLSGAHFLYGLDALGSREDRVEPVTHILAPLGGALMDLEASVRYRQRTAGEKVAMLSSPATSARDQVAAMDWHVRRLEARLGGRRTWPITWVRGPLLRQDAKACFDIAIGTPPGRDPVDREGLCALDRHEVAHCVITSFRSPWNEPPALLVEGWAEANSGVKPADLARRALEARDRGEVYALTTLCGPEWYGRHWWPVYVQGGPLVNFLLERFGPERFLRLYTTSRRATIAADVRRVLGMTLEALDAAYWADIERRVPPEEPSLQGRLARLELGPGVDRAEWQAFVAEYCAALERLNKPFEQVRMTVDWHASTTEGDGKTLRSHIRVRAVRSGDIASLRLDFSPGSGYGEIMTAHPRQSFEAKRGGPHAPWVVEDYPNEDATRRYRGALRRIDAFWFAYVAVPSLISDIGHRVERSGIVVEEFQRFTEGDRRYVRVRLADHVPNNFGKERTLAFVLSPDDLYSVRSVQIDDAGGSTQGSFEYTVRDGMPVVTAHHFLTTGKDGSRTSGGWTIAERSFEPTPESEFSPERLLDGPVVHELVSTSPRYGPPASVGRWYPLPLVLGGLALGAGAGLAAVGSRRRVEVCQPALGETSS
jgi:hypothetical protein